MGRGLRKPVAIWATLAMLLAFLSLGTGPAIALPASPTITGLTSTGPKYVAVSFTAADNGGTALSTYIYSTDNGTTWKVRDDATAGTAPALASPLVITSRSSSNGKAALGNNPAQIMIRACWALPNNPGASDFNIKCSATSNLQTITPGTPSAPTITSIAPGNTSLSVAFTAPSSDGGSTITNYEYSTDNGLTWTARSPQSASSPLTITGLTNGTTYQVSIRAKNTTGVGTASSSLPGTPASTPSAPLSLIALPGNSSVNVSWSAPSSNGGSAITGYTVTSTPSSTGCTITDPTVRTCAATGLTNGTSYTFTVRAVNSVGAGTAATTGSVTAGVPGAPIIGSVTPGDGQLSVSFTAPSSNGSAISNYEYTLDAGASPVVWVTQNPTSIANPLVITGLTNLTSYNIAIRAVNSFGTGAMSNSVSATPKATLSAPSAPTISSITPGNTILDVAFTVGSNGGATITNYEYTLDAGSNWVAFSPTTVTSPVRITGLTNGTLYTVQIRAVNSVGSGAASGSASGTPASVPGAPTSVSGVANGGSVGSGFVTVSWSAPSSTGGSPITGYKIEASSNAGSTYSTLIANTQLTATSQLVGGLTGGTSYLFRVRAINAMGSSNPSSASSAVLATTAPDAPVLTSVVSGSSQLTLNFTLGSNGGSAVKEIDYSTDNGATWYPIIGTSSGAVIQYPSSFDPSAANPATLANGTSYPVTLRAVTLVGTSASSNTINGTPLASASSDSALAGLTISSGTLSPTFAAGTFSYNVSVGAAVSSVTVTPTRNQSAQVITVNGTVVASGVASGAIALNVGNTTITVIDTAQNGATTTYAITVFRPSNNANLASLTLSAGTLSPTFDAGTISYTATVAYSVSSISAVATTVNADSTITFNSGASTSGATSTLALNVGSSNTMAFRVLAQDGTTAKTYTVTITRLALSTDSKLSNLAISSGTLSPSFSSLTTNYSTTVSSSLSSISVTPTRNQLSQTITVNGATVASGVASDPISLSVGHNTITVLVTAEDTTTTTYTLDVLRPSNNAKLGALTVSSGTLSPTFDGLTTSYSVTVGGSVSTIDVVSTLSSVDATQTINAAAVSSGATKTIALAVGTTTITIVVTAQDGVTTNTYTISVTRPSNDSSLSALSTSTGTLSPTFSSGTHAYSISVSNATTSISLTATHNHASQVISLGSDTLTSGVLYGPVALQTGANLITVHVVAQDGSYTNYVLTVNRATSTVSTLSSLVPSVGSFGTTFASGTNAYSMLLSNSVSQIRFTPTLTDSAASVTVAGTSVTSGTASGLINLSVGDQTVDVVVTAESGATRTYQITITRKSADATLSSLAVTGSGTWDANFASGTQAYAISVANSVSSITVTPTRSESHASITVNSTSVNSGSPSSAIALQPGATTTITVVVTAQDGNTISYVLSVTRDNIAPNAPTSVILSGSDTQLSVSWTAPTANTGSAVTGYTATASDGTNTFQCTTAVDANCVIIGLTNGVTYTVTVIATNSFGNSSPSASASGAPYQRPNVPDVSVTRFGNKSITVSWNAVGMGGGVFSSYLVERQVIGTTTSAWQTATRITDVNVRTYEDTNLDRAKRYNYRVTVETTSASSDNTAAAATVSNLVPRTTPADITPIKALGKLLVNLTWSAPSDTGDSAVTGYQIQYRVHGTSTWTDYYLAGPTEFSKQVTGLTKGTQYDFQIVVINDIGSSTSPNVVTETAVTVPGSLSSPGHSAKDLAVELTWSAPSDNGGQAITGYLVESSTDGSTWSTIATLASTATSYLAATPTKGATYNFRVSAINGIGSTETPTTLSSFVAVTHPGNGAAASTSKRDLSFDLTWVAATDDGGSTLTGYVIQQSIDGTNWTQVVVVDANTLSYTVTGLTAGVGYQFRVLPKNSVGTASSATVVSATAATKPGAPSSHGHTAVDQAITIEWVAPSSDGSDSILGYEVEVCEVGASSCAATVDVAPTATSYQATGLDKTKRYNINVKAKNSIGKSINAASFTNILAATGSGSSAPTVTAPSGVSSPITRGNPVIGSTLSLTQGNWTTTSGTVTLTYQWYVCSAPITVPTSTDPGCTLIVGATSPSFTVTSAQSGSYVTVAVTGVSGISPNETSLTVWATSTLVRAYTPSPERVRDVVLPNPKVKLDPKVPAAVIPLPENTGLISGQKKVEEGGSQVLVAITPNDTSTAIKVEATDWTLKFVPKTSTGEAVPIENARQMTVNRGGQVQVIGTSYLPRTTVKVWMFSTPVLLGEFLTDDFGNFSENVAIPAQLPLGEHTIQVAGVSPEDNLRSVSLPVITKDLKLVSGRAKFAAGTSAVTKTSQSQIAKFVTNALKNPKSLTIKVTTFATSKVQTSSEKALLSARLTAVKALITKLGYSGRIQVVTGTSAANAANSNQILVAASWLVSK